MRILAILAVPAIVLTSLSHAGGAPDVTRPPMLALSKEERVKVVAGLAADDASRRSPEARLY